MLKTPLARVVFDPVKLNLDTRGFNADDIDAIVITHEHVDHFDAKLALEIQRVNQTPIITTPFVAQKLEREGAEARSLKVGDSVRINDVTLHAEHCVHPANQPLSFIIETGVVALYYPVDSEPFGGMRELGTKYKPQIVLYMGTAKARLLKIIQMVKPEIVISHSVAGFAEGEMANVELKIVHPLESFIYA